MNKKALFIPLLLLSLIGCDTEDDATETDSVLVKKNEYSAIEFGIPDGYQTNIKLKLLNNIPVEAFLVTEEELLKWKDVTQTGDYRNATLFPLHSFYLTDSSVLEMGWRTLETGNYCILIENTEYGTISPSEHPKNTTGSASVSFSLHAKEAK